jgi:hypothetical protein
LTTYYCRHQLPVFNLAVQYLLWKSNSPEVDLHPLGIPIHSPAADPEQRLAVAAALMNYCDRRQMSSRERDETAAALAATLGIDYERIRRRRLLQILAPEEVTELARTGVDFQLHTHRHRTPFDRELFLREIQDNRRQIAEMTGRDPSHFCYPSGVYARQFLPWLQEAGVRSAVTCELGVAKPAAHLLLLPRLLDDSRVLTLDFEAWLCGLRG